MTIYNITVIYVYLLLDLSQVGGTQPELISTRSKQFVGANLTWPRSTSRRYGST